MSDQNLEDRRARRARFFGRLQIAFTGTLILFFLGISAWSINDIIAQGGAPSAVQQQAAPPPVQQELKQQEPKPAAPKAPPAAPQRRSSGSDYFSIDEPQ